jgi:hypothetical protein
LSSVSRSRRAFLCASVALGVELYVREGRTQSVEVPVRLQAELLSKVVAYDRGFKERARGHAQVLILVKGGEAESERIGEQIHAEIGVLKDLGGLPHSREMVRFTSKRAIADLCKSRGAAVLYVSVALLDEMSGIAGALEGTSILTVAAAASYVHKRAVLGFDAESGKPKLVVHLDQAHKQRVQFKPEVLKLARVVS